MARDRDSDAAAQSGQSKRPPLNHHVSHDSDSQVSDHASQTAHHRPKKHHVVGGGRLSSRVPSSKALHKSHHAASNAKLNNYNNNNNHHQNRNQQQLPLSPEQPERPPMLSAAHRRTTSDVRLTRDSSSSNLKKNASHTSLKRNKSHVEVGKKSKSTANIKRVSSHKDVTKDTNKYKGTKGNVHFDLGTDGQDDEWVDASASASPYLSRRGSVVSSGQGSAKPHDEDTSRPQSQSQSQPAHPATNDAPSTQDTPDRERVQHKEYLTSRLLQRTPSHGAPPKMSSETAQVPPRPISPKSPGSHTSSTPYDSPKVADASIGTSGDELTSRFVSGPASGYNPDSGSFFTPSNTITRVKRPQSLNNLHEERRSSTADDNDEDDDESALAPRARRRSGVKAAPADTSRTQQKLNLQRASSSMEPAPAGSAGMGAVGASPLLGGAAYDNRDPRIGKLIERTGQEYLVVRRFQNPVARSITRLQQLPGANKQLHIPKQNGTNGSVHSKKVSEASTARHGHSSSLVDTQRSRPVTPKRNTSVRLNGANSSYETEGIRGGLSGSSYVDGDDDDGVAALLRNLWDKNMDLSASQD
ncbi:hypothetical protein G7054_g5664 [Neopestalotiopsis clavispora]|jgi:hypothetical protein|nr:hypothetical protein G7054_g5664 [Neopestalotiopsis clavispora]